MLFNSYQYVLFLPIVLGLHFLLPHRFRWILLLVASCIFYMAFVPEYILILFAVILIDYSVGIQLEKSKGARRKWWLTLSLAGNLGILFFFKFSNFAFSNATWALNQLGIHATLPQLQFLLPLGLSFHVFQSLSYTMEVFYRRQKAEKHLGRLALYVLFFPQMVAGPIERPQNVLPQLRKRQIFSESDFVMGMRLILLGLFKKNVIADPLAVYCNYIFGRPAEATSLESLLAVGFFTLQIYFDFSGYSDIALGSARLFGIELMQNFKNPYLSTSLREFWTRWHVSLSTWFRDYLYIPLGGNRVGVFRNCLNLTIVFSLSGLWHGANWTYVIWGFVHAIGLVVTIFATKAIGLVYQSKRKGTSPWVTALKWGATLSYVSLAWVFFRANSVSDAFTMLRSIGNFSLASASISAAYFPTRALLACVWGIAVITIFEPIRPGEKAFIATLKLPAYVRFAAYAVLILMILNLSSYEDVPFVYFQF